MDPDATLKQLFQHLADENWEEAYNTLIDLDAWLNTKGGFLPKAVHNPDQMHLLLSLLLNIVFPLVNQDRPEE